MENNFTNHVALSPSPAGIYDVAAYYQILAAVENEARVSRKKPIKESAD